MRNFLIQQLENDAEKDKSIAFITGDLGFSVVEKLQEKIGNRFINAGVAEQNMISVSSGMASTGFVPWVYSIVPFSTMRCYEQIRNDICFHQKKVRIIGIGGGFSYGMLGASHHALEDTHIMSALPHMIVLNPAGKNQIKDLYNIIKQNDEAVYWRIGKGSGVDDIPEIKSLQDSVSIVKKGENVNIITSGDILSEALKAEQELSRSGISCNILSVPVIGPFPYESLKKNLITDAPIITVFEGYENNPLEIGVYKTASEFGISVPIKNVYARKEKYNFAGNVDYLRTQAGVSSEKIISIANDII